MESEIRLLSPEDTSRVAGGLTAAQWELAANGTACVISFAALGSSAGANILSWGAAASTCGAFFSQLYEYYEKNTPTQSGTVTIEVDESGNGDWQPVQTNNWSDSGSLESTYYHDTYSDYSPYSY